MWSVLLLLNALFFQDTPSVDDQGPDPAQENATEDNLGDDAAVPEPPQISTTKQKAMLALHSRLADIYPDDFHYKETNLPYWESASEKPFPLLIVDPELENTWLRPTPAQDEEYGYWKTADKLPPSKTTLVPPKSDRKQLNRPKYFHIPDESLGDLLLAPVREKVFLPPNIFDSPSVSVKASPHALLDNHLRTSLLENFTTDSYLRLLVDLSNCAAGTSSSVSPSEAASLLPEVAKQAALANARLQQSLTASYVGNTVALREYVLSSFEVPQRTQEYLRGGDFTTRSLFSPVPNSFISILDSAHGSEFRCTIKSSGSSYVATPKPAAPPRSVPRKRSGSARGYPRSKRSAPQASSASRGRGKRFLRGSAGRRSRPGRS